jgi:SAM-dependent methyltransferase
MFVSKPTKPQAKEKETRLDSWDYSEDAIQYIHERTKLNKGMLLADINSGTGKLTKHFLKQANTVYCIEHNKQFRQIAAEKFWKNRNFIEIDGTADRTHIESQVIDVIACGNGIRDCDAFRAIREFRRILKSDGWLILLENIPLLGGRSLQPSSPFQEESLNSDDLMKFYYPQGSWERREFYFHANMREDDIFNLTDGLENDSISEMLQETFQRDSQEGYLNIRGKTVLHIGQPGF